MIPDRSPGRTTRGMMRAALLPILLTGGCRNAPPSREAMLPDVRAEGATIRTSALQAGPATRSPRIENPFGSDDREIAEGRRLYLGMNCHGCHGALGGGGIGPPLADADWIYGGDDVNLYQSIMQGRPNGMPTFGATLPDESAWRIAAFVRSLSAGAQEREHKARRQGPGDQGALQGNRR